MRRVGGFRGRFPYLEDWDLFVRMALADARLIVLPQVLVRVSTSHDQAARRGGWRYAISDLRFRTFCWRSGFLPSPSVHGGRACVHRVSPRWRDSAQLSLPVRAHRAILKAVMSSHYQVRTTWWSWPLTSLGVLGGCVLWIAMLYRVGDVAPLIPVAIVAMVIGGILLWQVALDKRWAVIALFVVSFYWIASSFGVVTHKTGDVGLNWQNGPKFIFYLSFLALGVHQHQTHRAVFADPAMFCGVLYLGLALLSVTVSEAPLVTVAAVIIVVSYVMFACIVVQSLSIREVMLMATWTLAVYCLISLLAAPLVPVLPFRKRLDSAKLNPIWSGSKVSPAIPIRWAPSAWCTCSS